jgi:hypothetical protein
MPATTGHDTYHAWETSDMNRILFVRLKGYNNVEDLLTDKMIILKTDLK